MSKFTKLTLVAVFALLLISLFAVEAREYRRQETTPTPSGDGKSSPVSSPTGTGTDEPDTPPTNVPADQTPSLPPPVDTALPATGKASDIASLLSSAAKSGATPTPSASSGSGGSSGPATTPSSANKIESGIFGIAIVALVSLFL